METQETNGNVVHFVTNGTETTTILGRPAIVKTETLLPDGTDFYKDTTAHNLSQWDGWTKKDGVWTWDGEGTAPTKPWPPYVPVKPKRSQRLAEPHVPPHDCPSFATLRQMLAYKRSGRTRTEKKFIHRFISPLGMKVDSYGNYWKRIGDAPVMWACHTDSVHRQGGMQSLAYGKDSGLLYLSSKESSNCLGADDGAGIWIMEQMIRAGVEGLYVFHRDEESGGGGSIHFNKYHKAEYKHCKMCISLDRFGYNSVITHQGGRCCSDEFGEGLAAALNAEHEMFKFEKDSGGLFTDSANYTENIPECTNLSVGYFGHHNSYEEVSVPHLIRLKDALCNLDVASLPIKRDPCADPYEDYGDYNGYYGSKNWKDYEFPKWAKKGNVANDDRLTDDELEAITDSATMFDLVCDYPEEIVDLLEQYGFDKKQLLIELSQRGVVV